MKLKTLALVSLCAASLGVHAGPDEYAHQELNRCYHVRSYDNCVQEYVTKLSENEVQTRGCYQSEGLRLAWGSQSYPLMNDNPRRVQYWQGGFSKELTQTRRYLRELVDECRGRLLSSQELTRTSARTLVFPILNPNLSPDVTESYMLVPMTEAEARQELVEAQVRCSTL